LEKQKQKNEKKRDHGFRVFGKGIRGIKIHSDKRKTTKTKTKTDEGQKRESIKNNNWGTGK